jgi:hypothetical protein
MSKETRLSRPGPTSRAKRNHSDALSPRVREMVDGLHAICDAVEAGIPLEQVATVRTSRNA